MPATDLLAPSIPAIARRLAEAAAAVAGESWEMVRAEVLPHLRAVAGTAHATAEAVRAGRISRADADFVLECQQLYLASILRHVRLLGRVRGQRILAEVMASLAGLVAVAGRD